MIFQHTHQDVYDELKDMTRRLARPGDFPHRRWFPRHIAEAKGLTVERFSRHSDRAWVICSAARLNRHGHLYFTWKNGLLWPRYTYAVQPERNAPAIFHIRIISLALERLQEIDEVDALREGFESRAHFRHIWDAIQTDRAHLWDANPLVWALGFKKVIEKVEADERLARVGAGF